MSVSVSQSSNLEVHKQILTGEKSCDMYYATNTSHANGFSPVCITACVPSNSSPFCGIYIRQVVLCKWQFERTQVNTLYSDGDQIESMNQRP